MTRDENDLPPPRKKKKVIKPHTPKMNRDEQEVCNMTFSYLLFQWEGVVWPVLPKHLKCHCDENRSLSKQNFWARTYCLDLKLHEKM